MNAWLQVLPEFHLKQRSKNELEPSRAPQIGTFADSDKGRACLGAIHASDVCDYLARDRRIQYWLLDVQRGHRMADGKS